MDNAATPNFFARFNPKWIFVILGMVVLIELIVGIRTLTKSNVSTGQSGSSAAVSSKGRIALRTSQQTITVGDTVAVLVEVTSPFPSIGVDIMAKFDPKVLQASDSAIQKGVIFPQFPVAKIDSDGLVRISAITTPEVKSFSGKGILATINFKALKKGKTTISLDFTKGSTADSNIVSEGPARDFLEEVSNLEVTIK